MKTSHVKNKNNKLPNKCKTKLNIDFNKKKRESCNRVIEKSL